MKFLAPLIAGLVGLALVAGDVDAQGAQVGFGGMAIDTDEPVEVTANQLDVDQATGKAVFSGDVLIGQGEMRLSAARVEVIYADAQRRIQRMDASGGVTLVSGEDAAESERAEYDIDRGEIVMTGNVLLTQGPSVLSADRMVVDLESGTAQMVGRVRTLIQQGDQ